MAFRWTGKNTGLGDYIHLTQSNYELYGFHRRGSASVSAEAAAAQAYRELKSNIVKKNNLANVKDIELFLNSVLQGKTNQELLKKYNIDSGTTQDEEEALAAAIDAEMGSEIREFDRGILEVRGTLQSQGDYIYSGFRDKERQSVRIDTINKILSTSAKALKKLMTQQRRLMQQGGNASAIVKLGQTLAELRGYMARLNLIVESSETFAKRKRTIRFRNGGDTNEIGKMLANIAAIEASLNVTPSGLLGKTGELFGSFALQKADRQADITINSIISGVVGEKGSKQALAGISGDFVDKEALVTQISSGGAQWRLEDGVIVSSRETQDTVDVEIEFSEFNQLFGATEVRASIKNYFDITSQGSKGVHTISQVPLISILNLINTDFGNHYLNLLATGANKSLLDGEYTNTIKYAVAVRSLSGYRGDGSTNKLSDYFIVNSRAEGKIRVFSTSHLLEEITPFQGAFADDWVEVTGLPKSLSNKKVGEVNSHSGAMQRITNILVEAHRYKLSMSLKPAFFSSVKSGI